MGNTVGVDNKAVLFNEVGKLDRQIQPAKFPANLKGWKLSSDANRRCVTKMDAIEWNEIDTFDPKCCYLLLMSYAVVETKAQLGGASNNVEGSIISLLQSASGSVTPRGLSCAFASGEDNPSFNFSTNSANNTHSYGVFLWNGTDADPVVKATALTKAFALERRLIEEEDCIHKAYAGVGKPLQGTLAKQGGVARPSQHTQQALADSNELFHWLLRGPRRSFERFQDGQWPHVADAISQSTSADASAAAPPRNSPRRSEVPSLGLNKVPALNMQTIIGDSKVSPPSKPKLTLPGLSLQNLAGRRNRDGEAVAQSPGVPGMQSESAIRQGELNRYNHVCSQVLPYLCVGAQTCAEDRELLLSSGITHVVNCAGTIMENFHPTTFKYLKLHLYDAKNEDLSCLFYEIIAFVDSAREAGGKCFIHCHQGVSRSCTSIICYLMARLELTYEEAFAKTQQARPICNPNTGFICQLLDFHRRLTEPLTVARAHRVCRHAPHVPECTNFCARLVTGENNPLKRDECHVIHTPTRVFLWTGAAAQQDCIAAAREHVRRLQRFEGAPSTCEEVTAGAEPSLFWNSAAACGYQAPVVTSQSQPGPLAAGAPAPQGFELLRLNLPPDEHPEPVSVRGPRGPEQLIEKPKVPDGAEAKMFAFPDWDEVEIFDMDDLIEDSAFIVLPAGSPPNCIFVWLGGDFIEDFGYSKAGELAGEFLALHSMQPTTEVKIEVENEESELFWDNFVNG